MIPKSDVAEFQRIVRGLTTCASAGICELPDSRPMVLGEQLIESLRRRRFVTALKGRSLSAAVANPRHPGFDPVRAAIYFQRLDSVEESAWLTFIFTHCGRHTKTDYQLAAAIYAGPDGPWTFERILAERDAFSEWWHAHWEEIRLSGAKFGNHRKYETLRPESGGTLMAVLTYASWIESLGGHQGAFALPDGVSPEGHFEWLYEAMSAVARFGRTARFDYLNMVAKIGLSSIVPGRAFFAGSTGPLAGARLLFGEPSLSAGAAEVKLKAVNLELRLPFDVWEDGLCNWQKSPDRFISFRG